MQDLQRGQDRVTGTSPKVWARGVGAEEPIGKPGPAKWQTKPKQGPPAQAPTPSTRGISG
eukprot:916905-Alexandrium_andersonii.AAC.1